MKLAAPRWLLPVLLGLSLPTTALAQEEGPAAEAVAPPPPPARSRGGVALLGTYGVVNGHHAQVFRGLELHAVAPAVGKSFVGAVAGFDEGIDTGVGGNFADRREHTHYDHAYWDLWFAPQLGWGAPFSPTARVGFAIQTGVSAGARDRTLYSGFGNEDPTRYVSGFGAAAFRLTVCGCKTLRPFAGISGRWVLDHFGSSVQSAGIDLGLALAP
jgi:hypothetical protein